MEGKVQMWGETLLTVIICIAFYNLFVRPYTPAKIQGWIGL